MSGELDGQNEQPSEGELSQADIDAMMGGGSGESAPSGDAVDDSTSGELSQADIDAMMGGGAAETVSASDSDADSSGSEGIDQSDIDALFGNSSGSTGAAASADDGVSIEPEQVDQSDIDAILAAAQESADGAEEAAAVDDTRLDSMGRPFDAAAAAMAAAIEEEKAASQQAAAAVAENATPFDLPDMGPATDQVSSVERVSILSDVDLNVKIELGSTGMLVEDVLALGEGSVVELDKLAGDPVDVFVNERLVARGEVLVLNDNFCVRISEVLSHDPHRIAT